MNEKIVIFILTSNNEKLLKISYNSVINQKNHNIDLDIIIVVNSLNKNYINNVLEEFENVEDVEIIETESNGKPGMGHNSCIELFKNHKKYKYMLLLDGDDFLYPYALNQLEKCFKKEKNIQMLMLKSTDKLKYIEESEEDILDINLNNNFIISSKIYVEYKLYPWNKEHMNLSNFYNNNLCTPLRLFLLNREILNKIDIKLFDENCMLYDDYLTFLKFVKLIANNVEGCFIIPGRYIYLYNGINMESQTKKENENDLIFYKKREYEYLDVKDYLGINWDLTKLPYIYIDDYIKIEKDYNIDEKNYNINMSINLLNLEKDKNNIYMKKFGIKIVNNIIEAYKDSAIKSLENEDFKKSLNYSEFFDMFNIKNRYISFIYVYSMYKLNSNKIYENEINKLKKHILIGLPILNFYKMKELNKYCKLILDK